MSQRLSSLRVYWTANIGLWLTAYVVTTARIFVSDQPMPHQGEMAVRRAFVAAGAMLVSAGVVLVLKRVRGWSLAARAGVAVGCALAGATLYGLINHVAFYVIASRWETPSGWVLTQAATWALWIFIAWCAICFAIEYDAEAKDKAVRLASAQALALDAQNRMLRYQINPHFLFNTLNALSTLILSKENERAERVVLSLSAFLRHTLDKALPDKAPLYEELEVQRRYLSIEQIRFEERLQVCERIAPAAREALVPTLILQPLLENAVKHAVATSVQVVKVEISAEVEAGELRLCVCDDGAGAPAAAHQRLGVGLENVRRRLELAYGEAGRLKIRPREPRGFCAELLLPYEPAR